MADKTLNLAFRDLQSLPDNINEFTVVELDGNRFTEDQKLHLLTEVQHLSLTFNNLQEMWQLPPNLKRLEINNNMITRAISMPSSLVEIDFSHNFLQDISGLLNLPNLQYLFLKGNKIKSALGFGKLKHLIELDLSDNMLENIKDVFQFQGHTAITFLNIHGNDVFDQYLTQGRTMPNLSYIQDNCLCRSFASFQASKYLLKVKQRLDGCDMIIQADQQDEIKKLGKQLSIDVSEELQQQSQRRRTDNVGPKSLSPMNHNQNSTQPFFTPFLQTSKAQVNSLRQFENAVQRGQNNNLLKQLSAKAPRTSKLSTESDYTQQNYLDLKQQNQILLAQQKKLETQVQTLIVQHEQTLTELRNCKDQLQELLKLFNTDPGGEDLSRENICNIRPYLDQLQHKLLDYHRHQQQQTMQQMMAFVVPIPHNLTKHKVSTRIKIASNQVSQLSQDHIGTVSRQLLRIEQKIERIQDIVTQKMMRRNVPLLRISGSSRDSNEKCHTARHEKHNSDLIQPSRMKNDQLFIMSNHKMFHQQPQMQKRQNTSSTPQQIKSMYNKLKVTTDANHQSEH